MKMLSVNEAAKRVGMTPQGIRDALKEGRLKGYQSGRYWLVEEESLESFQKVGHRPKKTS
jgi:excisionase family DNA binding protein